MKQNLILAAICTCVIAIVFMGFECSANDYSLAKQYVNKKENDKALPLLEKETKVNPTNAEAWYYLGRIRGDKSDFTGMNVAFDSTLKYLKRTCKRYRDRPLCILGHTLECRSFLLSSCEQ